MARTSGALLVVGSLLLAACFPLDEETYEPEESPPLRAGMGLEAEAQLVGPDFESAEVILFVNGVECARRTMAPWKSRWSPTDLCGDPANRAELQFVAPAGRCAPGGVYAHTATTVGPGGQQGTFQGLTLAAWDASGAPLQGVDLGLDRLPILLAQGAETGEPAEEASLEDLARWSYRLEFSLEGGQAECADTLHLSLLLGSGPQHLDYRIVRAPAAEDGSYLLRVRADGGDHPAPALETMGADGAWEEAEAGPSNRAGWLEFPIPAEPRRFRLSFPFVRLPQRVAARMAYEPRQEIEEPLWVGTEAIVPRVQVHARQPASEAPEQPLPLAEHLARLLVGVAALQEDEGEEPVRLQVSVDFELAGVFRTRLPLVLGEADYRSERDGSAACEDTESLPCALAGTLLGGISNMGIETDDGAFLLGLRWYGAGADAALPQIDLRELYLPAAWVAELTQ